MRERDAVQERQVVVYQPFPIPQDRIIMVDRPVPVPYQVPVLVERLISVDVPVPVPVYHPPPDISPVPRLHASLNRGPHVRNPESPLRVIRHRLTTRAIGVAHPRSLPHRTSGSSGPRPELGRERRTPAPHGREEVSQRGAERHS